MGTLTLETLRSIGTCHDALGRYSGKKRKMFVMEPPWTTLPVKEHLEEP
jgi:hypothetical protein